MGLGYGSEYQLLRLLGHHRNELNRTIREKTRLKGELVWLDFPKDQKRLSLDGEYKGTEFLNEEVLSQNGIMLKNEITPLLQSNWKKYWATGGNLPNWDGIILHRNVDNEEWVIVEAKAHSGEIESKTNSGSNQNIRNAFEKTQQRFGIYSNHWFGKYYQLANRLAFVNFLLDNEINASLLYIYFLNGGKKCQLKKEGKKATQVLVKNHSVETREEWNEAIEKQYHELGINDHTKQYISKIFVEC